MLIKEAEDAAPKGEQGTQYRITKMISAKYKGNSSVLKDKDGKALTIKKGYKRDGQSIFQKY